MLVHRAHGPLHCDVIIGVGAKCPTWSLSRERSGWRVIRKPDHRRRYLTWCGPLKGGRGVVHVLGRGWVQGAPRAAGWSLTINLNGFIGKELRHFTRLPSAAFPLAVVWSMRGHGERVVGHRLIPRIPHHERLG